MKRTKNADLDQERESEQDIGMKRKNEKGVDDKSQDYAREREKETESGV